MHFDYFIHLSWYSSCSLNAGTLFVLWVLCNCWYSLLSACSCMVLLPLHVLWMQRWMSNISFCWYPFWYFMFDTYFIQFCTQLSWLSGVLKRTLLNKNEYIYVKDLSFQRLLKKYICVVWRTIKVGRDLMTMGKCGSQSETSWEPLVCSTPQHPVIIIHSLNKKIVRHAQDLDKVLQWKFNGAISPRCIAYSIL